MPRVWWVRMAGVNIYLHALDQILTEPNRTKPQYTLIYVDWIAGRCGVHTTVPENGWYGEVLLV